MRRDRAVGGLYLTDADAMACGRRFTILAAGGVRITWACGAELVAKDETAVDVEILADHLPRHHHHRHHLRLPIPHPVSGRR